MHGRRAARAWRRHACGPNMSSWSQKPPTKRVGTVTLVEVPLDAAGAPEVVVGGMLEKGDAGGKFVHAVPLGGGFEGAGVRGRNRTRPRRACAKAFSLELSMPIV